MPLFKCPHCNLLLTPDEANVGSCPGCAAALPGAPPPPVTNQPAVASCRPLWVGLAGLLLLGLALGGWFGYQHWAASQPDSGPAKDLAGDSREQPPPAPGPKAPAPKKSPKTSPAPEKKAPVAPPIEQLKNFPEPVAPVRPKEAPKPKGEVVEGDDLRLDRPDGEFVIDSVLERRELKLSGRVKTLRVGFVDGASTLDASKLEAQEVIFTGRIDGGSTVKLNVPGGKVEFRDRVDGRSTLIVLAPNGSVTFTEPTERGKPGSKIDGESQVRIAARAVEFRGMLNGTRTEVVVALSRGGTIKFRDVDGQVRLKYRTPDAGDPIVPGGTVRGNAKVERID